MGDPKGYFCSLEPHIMRKYLIEASQIPIRCSRDRHDHVTHIIGNSREVAYKAQIAGDYDRRNEASSVVS